MAIDFLYIALLNKINHRGVYFEGRNGGTKALLDFPQLRFNLQKEFPILSLRKQNFGHYLNEFLWEIRGGANINSLRDNGLDSSFLWETWADEEGYVAYSYGECWRKNTLYNIDQIRYLEKELKQNPFSRRLFLVTSDIDKNAKIHCDLYGVPQVPPCHPLIVFNSDGYNLNAHITARSQDIVVGLPGDLIRYSLMTMCLAQIANLRANEICFTFSNLHYYMQHEKKILKLAKKFMQLENEASIPTLQIQQKNQKLLFDFKFEDFILQNYNPQKFVSFPLIA